VLAVDFACGTTEVRELVRNLLQSLCEAGFLRNRAEMTAEDTREMYGVTNVIYDVATGINTLNKRIGKIHRDREDLCAQRDALDRAALDRAEPRSGAAGWQ
jgi:hypothetical protein